MDVDDIKNRILEFLKKENKSSAHFAQEIGVQPSAISHIISGRNKPSLDFVMKMINRYPFISTEWLLSGKEPMYLDKSQYDLFASGEESSDVGSNRFSVRSKDDTFTIETNNTHQAGDKIPVSANTLKNKKKTDRIVVFYSDNTFSEHFPDSE